MTSIIKVFYERLLEKGKRPLQALVAIMDQLGCGIIGMFTAGTDLMLKGYVQTSA